jgi:hypothetical protein
MSRSVRTRTRAITGIIAVAAVALVSAVGGAAPAQASMTCTWGGTPAEPTGTFTLKPGMTNFPASEPLAFWATGELAGDPGCTGHLIYDGEFNAGSTCFASTFEVKVKGLPGVARAWGRADNLVPAPSVLYDADGNVVGVEVAQIVTTDNAPHYADCNTPQGFTAGNFSSVVELY